MKRILFSLICLAALSAARAQLNYPYPVHYLPLSVEGKEVRMAYMDIPASPHMRENGKTLLLLHGKNFNGYYWKDLIPVLTAAGYRVIVPDQLGFGLSDKPDMPYSFHLLAVNTRQLLDTLGIAKVSVIAHSMGGMLATRFALLYPERIEKLVFENPIGLEDYRRFVPYRTPDEQLRSERSATYASLQKYQQGYYPEWKPEYEAYVQAQYASMQIPSFEAAARASARTYTMIYEQPVGYEFKDLKAPTLILIGQEDRTIVGKNLLSPAVAAQHGQYPLLGKEFHRQVAGSRLVELKGVGHIPHIQVPERFRKEVLEFLRK